MHTVTACWDEDIDGQQEVKREPGRQERIAKKKQTTQTVDHPGIMERFIDLWLKGSLIN